ncbi:DNA-binding protein [Bacteroidia bacterium]|nr:DNA-binding protein [Bacteroidia bacterium]
MTDEDKIQYWLNLSDNDLKVAGAMLQGRFYLYVAFMCHQSIEKIFKGVYIKLKNEDPPYTHDLSHIAVNGNFWDCLSETQQDFIEQLGPLNIRTRYPDYKQELAKQLSQERCKEILEQTTNLQQWTKKTLL